jgi:D-3-phosphoglycerate dehydrogenase
MVGQISTCLASAKINIADLLNKSRGEYAYTLLDTDGTLDQTTVVSICKIDGVLSARVV